MGIAYPEPLFVVDIDAVHNRVIVGTAAETYVPACEVKQVVWGGVIPELTGPMEAEVKYRSSGKAVPATLYPAENGVRIVFAEPQRAVTRGQSAVFYQGDYVLGGGIIV